MNVIRSRGHNVFTEEINKVALSGNDDKRYIKEDNVHTLAWNHYLIRQLESQNNEIQDINVLSHSSSSESLSSLSSQ